MRNNNTNMVGKSTRLGIIPVRKNVTTITTIATIMVMIMVVIIIITAIEEARAEAEAEAEATQDEAKASLKRASYEQSGLVKAAFISTFPGQISSLLKLR